MTKSEKKEEKEITAKDKIESQENGEKGKNPVPIKEETTEAPLALILTTLSPTKFRIKSIS